VPLVLITGLPGSGKSTLAASLGAHLDLPVIAKDRFKEILFDTLGSRDMAWSRQLGRAAIALQYDAMRTVKDAVVDSALWTGRSEPELEALGVPMVQVYCECPFDIARQRFFGRLRTGDRHPGFAEQDMTPEDYERFRPLTAPLRLPVPLVRVDTATAVDTEDLAVHVRAALRSLAPTR
jgi:predicted kinase